MSTYAYTPLNTPFFSSFLLSISTQLVNTQESSSSLMYIVQSRGCVSKFEVRPAVRAREVGNWRSIYLRGVMGRIERGKINGEERKKAKEKEEKRREVGSSANNHQTGLQLFEPKMPSTKADLGSGWSLGGMAWIGMPGKGWGDEEEEGYFIEKNKKKQKKENRNEYVVALWITTLHTASNISINVDNHSEWSDLPSFISIPCRFTS